VLGGWLAVGDATEELVSGVTLWGLVGVPGWVDLHPARANDAVIARAMRTPQAFMPGSVRRADP
jgi:hypothetical protein